MGIILVIIAIISGSALLTFGVVKAIPKIESAKNKIPFPKVAFPKINFPVFRWRNNWLPKYFRKEEPRNIDEYDLEITTINGEQVPRLVPKKPKEEKGGMPLPLTKNVMVMMAGVVVVALVGYYVTKKWNVKK